MTVKTLIPVVLVGFAMSLAVAATRNPADKDKDKEASNAAAVHAAQDDTLRLEGEKKFHSNCGRCHAAPLKFSPNVAATIVRHMRVRACITDEEARLILRYLAQ